MIDLLQHDAAAEFRSPPALFRVVEVVGEIAILDEPAAAVDALSARCPSPSP